MAKAMTEEMAWERIPVRAEDAHKGTCGSVLACCGSIPYRGAAALCTMGALRSGAGLVTLAAPEEVIESVASRILEAVYLTLPDDVELARKARRSSVCAVGCGKEETTATAGEVNLLLQNAGGCVVLDAGGLCSLLHADPVPDDSVEGKEAARKRAAARLARSAPDLILTPHPGEMAKLTGLPVAQITADPEKTALEFAAQTKAVVVLKGHVTRIASPDGHILENHTGCAGLARGGSGDVLTGIIAGLCAQGLAPFDAAACGVWLHGRAADLCAKRLSVMGMLPSDILYDLGQIFLAAGR